MTAPDTACLCCGYEHTCNGFLCVLCLHQRAHTRHWRWLSPAYLRAIEQEIAGPIVQPHQTRKGRA